MPYFGLYPRPHHEGFHSGQKLFGGQEVVERHRLPVAADQPEQGPVLVLASHQQVGQRQIFLFKE